MFFFSSPPSCVLLSCVLHCNLFVFGFRIICLAVHNLASTPCHEVTAVDMSSLFGFSFGALRLSHLTMLEILQGFTFLILPNEFTAILSFAYVSWIFEWQNTVIFLVHCVKIHILISSFSLFIHAVYRLHFWNSNHQDNWPINFSIFYLLDMEVLWVHLQKFCSGPLKWHRLSQSDSSEKQPKIKNKQTKNALNEWNRAKEW